MLCARLVWCASLLTATADQPPRTVEVSVEQADGERWRTVDPRVVFHPGDEFAVPFPLKFCRFLICDGPYANWRTEVAVSRAGFRLG